MDELGWSWPAWKFGMRREDLTTKLHDQYNTFPSSIQDPEAFHHDVFEISNQASTTDEFHQLMAERKHQRLQELNDALENAAFEIIGHPRLIGTEQWQYALQLFRTKSLDSLVRYFSSYLESPPASGYQTPHSMTSSYADEGSVAMSASYPSTKQSSVDDNVVDDSSNASVGPVSVPTFLGRHDEASFTHEPQSLHDSGISYSVDTKIPLSPCSMTSMTTRSDECSSASTPSTTSTHDSTHDFTMNLHTPPRTMSFSGSETDSIPALSKSDDDDETSQSEGEDSPAASEPDLMESRSSLCSIEFPVSGSMDKHHHSRNGFYGDNDEEEFPTAQPPADVSFADDFDTFQAPLESCESMESETPTPRQETASSCYMDSKASFHQHNTARPQFRSSRRSVSPKTARFSGRDVSPPLACRKGGAGGAAVFGCLGRRSPDEAFSRVQKFPLSDPARTRAVMKGFGRGE